MTAGFASITAGLRNLRVGAWMTDRQRRIELITKLLALGKSPYPAEAEAAKQKAASLMKRYEIAKQELVPQPPAPPPPAPMQAPGFGVVSVIYTDTDTNSTTNWG